MSVVLEEVGANIVESLERILSRLQWKEIISTGSKVALKLNLCDSNPRKGVVTSPEVVKSLISILSERTDDIIAVESDGNLIDADTAYRATGMKEAINEVGARFVNLSKDAKRVITPKNTLYLRKYMLPRTLEEADVLITLPLLKTHELTLFTGAIKNQFGCYPQHNRVLLHSHLDEALVDINWVLRPKLAIMDARTAIQGNGPTRGYPVKMGLFLGSRDLVALDAVALHLMCIEPERVSHVCLAGRRGLGKIKDLETDWAMVNKHRRKFLLPYDDAGNRFQKMLLSHHALTRVFFDSPLKYPLVRFGRIIRKALLHGKTDYF
ncbi:MAG: DUF362 domain-containing protein [Candidatus Hodarchaeota archaeon]